MSAKQLCELTYYSAFKIDNTFFPTRQALLERDETLRVIKQHTRYSTHGIHEYKGKFNPQIVHALLNILNITKDCVVLDPFNGSGTTILESAHAGIQAVGTDINPMACFISNAKIKALSISIHHAEKVLDTILNEIPSFHLDKNIMDERLQYLYSWIPENTLTALEGIRASVAEENDGIATLFLSVASDLIREYSYQEPSDLRIRRRISPFPEMSFIDAFENNVLKYLKRISEIQDLPYGVCDKGRAIHCDIKTIANIAPDLFDAAITSPPYVTALPYVDTQRISLVWLGLCNASEIRKLETQLIGNREISKSEKNAWSDKITTNMNDLPEEVTSLAQNMLNSLSSTDGFRKQAVPALTYKYFSEMKEMFCNVKRFLKPNAPFALIVGHNRTTLGNQIYYIDTPRLLAIVAQSCGWEIEEISELQTYVRYGLNSKNSIARESLIILKNA